MSGFQAVPNVMRADFRYQVGGQYCISSFYARKATPCTFTDVSNFATAMHDDFWVTNLRPLVTSDFSQNGVSGVALDAPDSPFFGLDAAGATQNGTESGMSIPSGSCLVTTFKTAERSRNGRGRVYTSGIPLNKMADPTEVTTDYLADFITAMNSLITIATALSATLVVVSRWLNKVQRSEGVAIPITSITLDRYVDSQRRRLFGRGI
ncbi:MAG: hypothetical protein [Circular genetic element sp.]|nr:MAG: hypothetical protein [Circular genetic element sp.]